MCWMTSVGKSMNASGLSEGVLGSTMLDDSPPLYMSSVVSSSVSPGREATMEETRQTREKERPQSERERERERQASRLA